VSENVSSLQPTYRKHAHQHVRALTTGEEFFDQVASIIDNAQQCIYMSFWHVNDKVYLRRANPSTRQPDLLEAYRFDNLLKRKAEQGVRIYMLLWKEKSPKHWVDNYSAAMKKQFESLHTNIQVHCHGHPSPLVVLWSHHQKFLVVDNTVAIVGGFDVCMGRYDTHEKCLTDPDSITWPGVDYYNPHVGRPTTISDYFDDFLDRKYTPRMPWHDLSVVAQGAIAQDVSDVFEQRWHHHTGEKIATTFKFSKTRVPSTSPVSNLFTAGNSFQCQAQLLRTQNQWSGASRPEASIYGCILDWIESAEHYIYIENQYIASSTAGGGIRNQVIHVLLAKLQAKMRKKEQFRVYILVPLPEETGEGALSIIKWMQRSIERLSSSLLPQLRAEFSAQVIDEYIAFFALQRHEVLESASLLVTEKVYIHSKLLIVDDTRTLISSANLNDRSLLAERDTELGIAIEDEKFAQDVRMRLWCEHLGLPKGSLIDPTCASTWQLWLDRAEHNTNAIVSVFPGVPNNDIASLDDLRHKGGMDLPLKLDLHAAESTTATTKWMKRVRDTLETTNGNIIKHPLRFLHSETYSLTLTKFIKEKSCQ
jgi:phospholipase D1/2